MISFSVKWARKWWRTLNSWVCKNTSSFCMTVILNIHFCVAQLNPGLSVRLQRDTAMGVVVKLEEKWSCHFILNSQPSIIKERRLCMCCGVVKKDKEGWAPECYQVNTLLYFYCLFLFLFYSWKSINERWDHALTIIFLFLGAKGEIDRCQCVCLCKPT